MATPQRIKYIYILSQRYSGSTLLSFLLAMRPEVSTIGELRKFYNKSIKYNAFTNHRAKHCSCGKLFEECDHFNTIKEQVLSKNKKADLETNVTEFNIFNSKIPNELATRSIQFQLMNGIPLGLNPLSKRVKSILDFNLSLVQEILKIDQGNVFLDSSKSMKHLSFLSLIKELDLHVVWLVRDPRAQINSAMKYNKSWTVEMAANYWMEEMVDNEKKLNKLGLKYHKLRYEDLCKAPKKELQNIYQFAGINAAEIDLDFRKKEQHIIGNGPMRLGSDNKIVERKEWKEQLSSDQISQIESMTYKYSSYYSN